MNAIAVEKLEALLGHLRETHAIDREAAADARQRLEALRQQVAALKDYIVDVERRMHEDVQQTRHGVKNALQVIGTRDDVIENAVKRIETVLAAHVQQNEDGRKKPPRTSESDIVARGIGAIVLIAIKSKAFWATIAALAIAASSALGVRACQQQKPAPAAVSHSTR